MDTSLLLPGSAVLVTVAALALLHASFQLGVSVLSLLSGHAFGRKASHRRVLHLGVWYITGVLATILSLTLALAYLVYSLEISRDVLWPVVTVAAIAAGTAVLLFYYRRGSRLLWLPKPIAQYLMERTKKTKSGAEAASLGIMTVVAELPFVLAPMLLAVLLLYDTALSAALPVYAFYTLAACLPLLVVLGLIGGGHKVSRIQAWRDNNKGFLQFVSGAGLIVVSLYALVGIYMESGLW
jgi:hypothetical protein